MEQKLALVNCLALQYHESKLSAENGNHNNLIKKTLSYIKLPDLVADGDDRSSLISIRQIINDVCDGEYKFDKDMILQKIRLFCAFDKNLFTCIEDALKEPETPAAEFETKKHIASYVDELMLHNNRNEAKKLVSKASYTLNNESGFNYHELIGDLQNELSKLDRRSASNGEQAGFVARVTTETPEAAEAIFDNTKKQLSGAVLRTGWQGINRMMGVNGGIVPGECWVMPALPHNAKTTFSFSMLLSLALFNDPKDFVDDGRTPMILDISLENELEVNLPIGYKMVREHFDKQPVNIHEIDSKEAAAYLTGKLKENGWFCAFERYTSSDFTVETLRNIVNTYEAAGYRIVAMRVDYLGVSNKEGLSNGTAGSEVREMYRRARNICSPKKIALLSPHQLSPAAKQLKAMDPHKYVRMLPGKGYYDGCTTVDNEVDGELFFGITEVNNYSYLEIQRGKHRTIIDTPLSHRYRVLKFAEIGTLPWDIDLDKDTSLASVNADSMAGEEDILDF